MQRHVVFVYYPVFHLGNIKCEFYEERCGGAVYNKHFHIMPLTSKANSISVSSVKLLYARATPPPPTPPLFPRTMQSLL